ncbi:hypothetical protein SLS57_002502 [Botryosphaeria dothidea]
MGPVPQRNKKRADGTTVGTGAVYRHHCGQCGQAVTERCFKLLHMAYCEVPKCGNVFWTQKGCSTHCFSDGYNIETYAKSHKISVEEAIEKVFINPKHKPEGYDDMAPADNIIAIRKIYEHDMAPVEENTAEKSLNQKAQKAIRASRKFLKMGKKHG